MGYASRPAIGSNLSITLANELIQGTVPAAASFNMRFDPTGESVSASESTLDSASLRNTRNRPAQARGVVDVSGDLSCEFGVAGYGRMLYHSLGNYSGAMENVDGAAHGRTRENFNTLNSQFLLFMDDRVVAFEEDGSTSGAGLAILYRRNDGTLEFDNNGGTFYPYTTFSPALRTQIYSGAAAVQLITGDATLQIAKGADGETFLDCSTDSGFLFLQIQDRTYRLTYTGFNDADPDYFEVDITHIDGTVIGASQLTVADAEAGDYCWQPSCIWRDSGDGFLFNGFSDAGMGYTGVDATTIPSGAWVYGRWIHHADVGVETIYTHHYEIAQDLPTGLSVEVLRDVVNFIYSGCMVNTATFNFDSQSFVGGTFSVVGMDEYTSVQLSRVARPGDTQIYVSEEPVSFPDGSGTLCIGQEAGITFTGYVAPNTGGNTTDYWMIEGIPASGDDSIEQSHQIGENVDSMNTVASTPPTLIDAPKYSSFETHIMMKDAEIEVLSASLTLNNNINTDKYGLGSRTRLAVREGRAIVDGTLSVEFDSGFHYRKFVNGDFFSLEVRIVSEDPRNVINSLYHPANIFFFMPRCRYTGSTPNVADESYILQDAPFQSYEDGDVDGNPVLSGIASLVVIMTNRESVEN